MARRILKKKFNRRNATMQDIEKTKKQATAKAVDIVTIFPALILRTKYGFGEKRLSEFLGHFKQMVEDYNNGYLDLQDAHQTIKEETGITIEIRDGV